MRRVSVTVMLVCVATSLISATSPASAALPGDNGRIAFLGRYDVGQDELDSWIDAVEPDGSGYVRLQGAYNSNSPDGYGPFGPHDGEFIPGVPRLWFTDAKMHGPDEVWRVASDGSGEVSPSAEEGPVGYAQRDIAVSPDGSRAAFSRYGHIRIVNYDGGQVRVVRKNFLVQEWSPDGRKLLATRDRDLWMVPLDGGPARRLTHRGTDPKGKVIGEVINQDFSPNGRRIVFQFFDYENDNALRTAIMKADGTDEEPVSIPGGNPLWSPDGEFLAYTKSGGLYISKPDGSGEELVYEFGGGSDTYHRLLDWESRCTITGEEDGDDIVGTPGDDVICGLGGNDDIRGRGGDDVIFGGPGADVLRGGNGRDVLNGGAGNDALFGQDGADVLSDIFGTDEFYGGAGSDHIYALDSGRSDTLRGRSGRDRCWGNRIDATSCENHGYGG